ncbi:MAG: hypothetical protein HOV80_35380 [Polyangiaceae bacterium]|nr:hypothetical protein [Polyangiaceae bacterium]
MRVTSLGIVFAGALTVGSGCGLLFGDVDARGGGGAGAGEGGTLSITSTTNGIGGKDEGGGGGGGSPPMDCPARLDSIDAGSWMMTMASASITDITVEGQTIFAVGKATPDVFCGVPFEESGLMGDRLFLIGVEEDTGTLERVVDLGPADGNEIRLSHGNGQGEPLVAWTHTSGLCVMSLSDASSDCPPAVATLRCDLTSGSFSNIGVAATSEPVVLFRKPDGNGSCEAGGSTNIELGSLANHLLVNASDAEATTIGAPAGIRMGMAQTGPGGVRITGICGEGEFVMGQPCEDANGAGMSHMFMIVLDVDGADLAMPDFFSPIATLVTPQFGFVAPSAVGVAYSAQQAVGDARRVGWGGNMVSATPLTQLKFDGSGDLQFPTGVRSVETDGGLGQIVTGVALTSASRVVGGKPLFDCGLAECVPYSFWIHTPEPPDPGTEPYPVAVVGNDQSGIDCPAAGTAVEHGFLVGQSALLGGKYACGRPVVGATSYGLATEGNTINAFLARIPTQTVP